MTDTRWNIPSLAQHVRKKPDKDVNALKAAADHWVPVWADNHQSYEIEWMGMPVIQSPEDLILIQELIFKLKPDLLIETGVAHGGSLIYYSSLFELLGKGRVLGIDIEIRAHNRAVLEQHPLFHRVSLIERSSTADETIDEVRTHLPSNGTVLVCLDSDHTRAHVFEELNKYAQFVTPGSYMVVFDTHAEMVAAAGKGDQRLLNNGPATAVKDFLSHNTNFEVDHHFDRLFISTNPGGYLKRIK